MQTSDLFWENEGWNTRDKHLLDLKKMPFQRSWPFIPTRSGLYIIRGPRQIGKTSWLKSILSYHVPAKTAYYLSCEEIIDFRDLGQLLRSIKDRELIILDEVSFIDGWDRAVKHFIDSGYNGILCVSGSHAYDLEKGADLMPGRFGEGGEFHLLPMTFDEYCEARSQAGWLSGDRVKELRSYFNSGGFPVAVASAGPEGVPSAAIRNTYLKWLKGDAKKLNKDPEKVVEILIQIFKTMQSPISYQTLAKKTSIGSPNTVIDYVRLLESSFAIRTHYAVDIDSGALKHRSDKKFYFSDPLIYWIARDLAGEKTPKNFEDCLAEMTSHEHLARRYRRFGYLLNKQGEVDFVAAGKWCVEVKWAPIASNLSKAFHNLALPQKIVWTQKNIFQDWPTTSL